MKSLLDTVEPITQDELKKLLQYDKETGEFIWKVTRRIKAGSKAGYLCNTGYISIKINGKQYLAHRLVWLYVYGFFPKYLDHINRDKQDNRICNLRLATNSENNANRVESRKAASGFQGVVKISGCNRWKPQIKVNNKYIYLGSHKTPEAAYEVYLAARNKYFGEFNILRHMAEGEE